MLTMNVCCICFAFMACGATQRGAWGFTMKARIRRNAKVSRRYYLIDTENVGDRWLVLPEKLKKEDRIVTFFTENHSKKLEAYFIKQLHNPKIVWLECAVGNNALDYQLIGVLAYLIAKHPKASFFIFSNDKDYQPTVDFWTSRGIRVTQTHYEVTCHKKKAKKKKEKKKGKKRDKQKTAGAANAALEPEIATKLQGVETESQYIEEIAKSVPVSSLNSWHSALLAAFGQKKGGEWYRKIKEDQACLGRLSANFEGDAKIRGTHLTAVVLRCNGLDVACAKEAYEIIRRHNLKNKSAIKADFDKAFKADPTQNYYRVLRPIFLVLKKL